MGSHGALLVSLFMCFNNASYATLLLLLAEEANLSPGVLQGTFADCHIYENQIDGAKEQLKRKPVPLPTVDLGVYNSIYTWDSNNANLLNYHSCPKIDFGPVAV